MWALLLFVVVTLFTPGPNNTMLMTTGLNFGFRRGLPHLWGVALGFRADGVSGGPGARRGVSGLPVVYVVLKYVGAAYLLYLAWQIATAGAIEEDGASGKAHYLLAGGRLPVAQPEGLGDGGGGGVGLRDRGSRFRSTWC